MGPDDYQQAARMTARADMPNLTTRQVRILNWALGLGEVGELQNIIKKWVFHGHSEDREAIIDELGDILWYVANIAYDIDASLSMVMDHNVKKLRARYPEGFNPESSINRES